MIQVLSLYSLSLYSLSLLSLSLLFLSTLSLYSLSLYSFPLYSFSLYSFSLYSFSLYSFSLYSFSLYSFSIYVYSLYTLYILFLSPLYFVSHLWAVSRALSPRGRPLVELSKSPYPISVSHPLSPEVEVVCHQSAVTLHRPTSIVQLSLAHRGPMRQ